MNNSNVNLEALLKRGYLCLEDKEWERANTFFEQSLNLDAELAEAYLGKLMADLRISHRSELEAVQFSYENNNNYIKTLRFADEELKKELVGYINSIKERNENARLEGIYSQAQRNMQAALDMPNPMLIYKNTAELLSGISGYKDSDLLRERCLELSETVRKNNILIMVRNEYPSADPQRLEQLIQILSGIEDFKDASELIGECKKRIDNIEKSRIDNLFENIRINLRTTNIKQIEIMIEELSRHDSDERAIALTEACQKRIEEINEQNEKKRLKKQKTLKLVKRLSIIAAVVIVLAVTTVLLLKFWIIPQSNYNKALELFNDGKYEDAEGVFRALDGYKDSDSKVKECEDKITEAKYNEAVSLMDGGEYIEAKKIFKKLDNYKDSAEMVTECDYQRALVYFNSGEYDEAIEILSEMTDYKDSTDILVSIAEELEDSGDVYAAAVSFGKLAEKDESFWEVSRDLWGQITRRHTVSAGWHYTVAVKTDGTVYATAVDLSSDYLYGQANVRGWSDIIAIDAGWDHTVGLKSDGTVVAVGNNEDGQCNVEDWTHIVAINASSSQTYGLRADGTMISTDSHEPYSTDAVIMDSDYGLTTLNYDGTVSAYDNDWTDMIDIADNDILVGLCADGTVKLDIPEYYDGIVPDVSGWKNIVDIDTSMDYIVGLKSDGTVVVKTKENNNLNDCSDWKNVVQISSNASHIIGLTADGRVLSTGRGDYSDVSSWKNILVNE